MCDDFYLLISLMFSLFITMSFNLSICHWHNLVFIKELKNISVGNIPLEKKVYDLILEEAKIVLPHNFR